MTAVEFLIEQLKGKSNYITWNEIFEQTIEMEKQQIIDAYDVGLRNGYIDSGKSPEQYYKETYGI